jgi:hypothetical protein
MDINHDRGQVPPSSPTKPLRIRKQPSQIHVARSQQQLNNNSSKHSSNPSFPPRTSPLRRYNDPDASGRTNCQEKTHTRQKSDNTSTLRSTVSQRENISISDNSFGQSPSTARSTVSSYKEHYLSGSSEIIGNFVPLDSANMVIPPPKAESNGAFPSA